MAKTKKRVKAYPAPQFTLSLPPYWAPNKARSQVPVVCKGCHTSNLYWSWNFGTKRPQLINDGDWHNCQSPNVQDVFPGWCDKCPASDLVYRRMKDGFELTESYGLPHTCEQDRVIQDMKLTKCKYCLATNLFCLKVEHRYTFVNSNGTKHLCEAFSPYMKDWAEAKRMDYAFEKAWINSLPDGHKCKKCKGKSYTTFLSKNKKTLAKFGSTEPIEMRRRCLKCKRIGTFTNIRKKDYLKELRGRYWPYQGYHKWKKADKGL